MQNSLREYSEDECTKDAWDFVHQEVSRFIHTFFLILVPCVDIHTFFRFISLTVVAFELRVTGSQCKTAGSPTRVVDSRSTSADKMHRLIPFLMRCHRVAFQLSVVSGALLWKYSNRFVLYFVQGCYSKVEDHINLFLNATGGILFAFAFLQVCRHPVNTMHHNYTRTNIFFSLPQIFGIFAICYELCYLMAERKNQDEDYILDSGAKSQIVNM